MHSEKLFIMNPAQMMARTPEKPLFFWFGTTSKLNISSEDKGWNTGPFFWLFPPKGRRLAVSLELWETMKTTKLHLEQIFILRADI